MQHPADRVLADGPAHQGVVFDGALDEDRAWVDGPAEAGDQIVDDDGGIAGVEQFKNRVAADIAGAARDQDGGLGPADLNRH